MIKRIEIVITIIIVIVLSASCISKTHKNGTSKNNSSTVTSTTKEVKDFGEYGKAAYSYVEYMQSNLTNRTTGTQVEKNTADYIINELKKSGYKTEDIALQTFSFSKGGKTLTSQNVVVTKKGDSEKVIVVGAHYDCAKTSGVDDNGSGVAVSLENAIKIKEQTVPFTIKFVFFGAEEAGACGSKEYVKSLSDEEKKNIILMVNLDTVLAGDKAYIYGGTVQADGTVKDTWAFEQAKSIADELKLDININPGKNKDYKSPSTGDWSDHISFKNAGIPYVYFESANWDLKPYDGSCQTEKLGQIMHTSNDDLNIINKTFPGRAKERLATFSMLLYEVLIKCKPQNI